MPEPTRFVSGPAFPAVTREPLPTPGPSKVHWNSRKALSSAPHSKSTEDLLEHFWKMYHTLGRQGLCYSPLLDSQPGACRAALFRKLAPYEPGSLRGHLNAFRRWPKFAEAFVPDGSSLLASTVDAVYAFLEDQSPREPTVARGLFQSMAWLRRQVGVPFPLDDTFVASLARVADAHEAQQSRPLPIPCLFALARMASSSDPNLAAFAGFALLPLVACLRQAHLQRSSELNVRDDLSFR